MNSKSGPTVDNDGMPYSAIQTPAIRSRFTDCDEVKKSSTLREINDHHQQQTPNEWLDIGRPPGSSKAVRGSSLDGGAGHGRLAGEAYQGWRQQIERHVGTAPIVYDGSADMHKTVRSLVFLHAPVLYRPSRRIPS